MSLTPVTELDIIYLSYDEPNCENLYAKLLEQVPFAKRVHGVKGSDSAHKACANLSDTERFVLIDADNLVYPSFFDIELDFESDKFKNKSISFASKNHINGLVYGNGGVKIFMKDHVLNMKTHENADATDKTNQVDFCWQNNYVQMNNCFSENYQNGSALQAFRSGFREGVKLGLDRGERVGKIDFEKRIWSGNYKRLITWMSVGADIHNGNWARYGALIGCYMTNLTDWNFIQVRNFDWLNEFFITEISPKFESIHGELDVKLNKKYDNTELYSAMIDMIYLLRIELGINCVDFTPEQSKFIKDIYIPTPRMGKLITEEEFNDIMKVNI